MDREKIKKLAFELMSDRASAISKERGEKYYHGERVALLVIKLRKYLFPEDCEHDDILTVAAWFHDVAAGENHNAEGAEIARKVLAEYCTEYELDEICKIISVHDDRKFEHEYSKYIKLHQDADQLDHFGVFEVWRSFTYAISFDETILDKIEWMTTIRPKESERYRRELNFDVSKRIFDEKEDFLKEFTKRFRVECSGGIWKEESFLVKNIGHTE